MGVGGWGWGGPAKLYTPLRVVKNAKTKESLSVFLREFIRCIIFARNGIEVNRIWIAMPSHAMVCSERKHRLCSNLNINLITCCVICNNTAQVWITSYHAFLLSTEARVRCRNRVIVLTCVGSQRQIITYLCKGLTKQSDNDCICVCRPSAPLWTDRQIEWRQVHFNRFQWDESEMRDRDWIGLVLCCTRFA